MSTYKQWTTFKFCSYSIIKVEIKKFTNRYVYHSTTVVRHASAFQLRAPLWLQRYWAYPVFPIVRSKHRRQRCIIYWHILECFEYSDYEPTRQPTTTNCPPSLHPVHAIHSTETLLNLNYHLYSYKHIVFCFKFGQTLCAANSTDIQLSTLVRNSAAPPPWTIQAPSASETFHYIYAFFWWTDVKRYLYFETKKQKEKIRLREKGNQLQWYLGRYMLWQPYSLKWSNKYASIEVNDDIKSNTATTSWKSLNLRYAWNHS